MKTTQNLHTLNTAPVFEEGSAEQYLLDNTSMNRNMLSLSHSMFTAKIVGEDLMFDIGEDIAKSLFYENIIEDKEIASISYMDVILSPYESSSFDIIGREARTLGSGLYNEADEEWQFRLFCYYCYNYFMAKFGNIKKLEDITRPLPTPLFVNVLSKQKDMKIAYRTKEGFLFAGTLCYISVRKSWSGQYVQLQLDVITKSKEGFTKGRESFNLMYVNNASKIEDLGLISVTEELQSELTERGRKYVKYTQKPTYCHYKGFGFRDGGWFGNVRTSVNGRIMTDLESMRVLNPNTDDNWYAGDPFGQEKEGLVLEVREDLLWMCLPCVYGFSFSTKDWLKIDIDEVSDIIFSNTAFDELIVPGEYKHIFTTCLKSDMPSLDSIEGKGKGKIFLLYGPAGTGKTMTAESVAEYLRLPLYYVTIGELGISPDDIETNLSQIMSVAQSWGAIVLLDEVDVFARKREDASVEVCAMTAVFLRLLERFDGIMFMTTNLKKGIDTAFISRATACIEYEDLQSTSRYTIWKNLLKKAASLGLNVDEDVDSAVSFLADKNINGREIKNCVRLAYSVAMAEEEKRLTAKGLYSIVKLSHVL